MAVLTRDALLTAAAQPLPRTSLDLPELGGEVFVRAMSGKERDAFEGTVAKDRRQNRLSVNVRARLVAQCLVDEAGVRLLSDADAEQLGEMRADVLDRIFDLAQRLSGFSAADVTDLEKAAKA